MANVIVRLIDKIGEMTLSKAELAYKRAKEISLALNEQEEAAKTLLERKKKKKGEKIREIEERLEKLREAVALPVEEKREEMEEIDALPLEREELKVPFKVRLINIISEPFSGFSARGMFKNIQEDLYRANILMPASRYAALAVGIAFIAGVGSGLLFSILLGKLLGLSWGLLGFVLGFPIFGFVLVFAKIYPKSKVKKRSEAFSRELPFALRHMATQLTAGSGLLETMRSVAASDYGVLSEEFRRAIHEIERGATLEEALERMNLRVDSPGMKKATRQIISTLKTGGNLAKTLKMIAEETATEMRMKLKDFIQTLNTFSLMYMFIVVVAPVLITILIIAMSIATKNMIVPPLMMMILYLLFLFVSFYMAFMIKRFEPKV
ncbi:MAG: type II secretion system F family protein [Candidatus Hydrothermarchaeota archaeon]|nr:MAG: type II secretion system F family protein [Candidatus Hydrothermarchaeota archaeon]